MVTRDSFELEQAKDIGKFFAQLRYKAEKTQKEVAEGMGTRQSIVSLIESSAYDSRLSTLQALARSHGYRLDISLVPIDGGDSVSVRSDPNAQSTRTYGGNSFSLKKPRAVSKRVTTPHKPIAKVPDVEYEFEGEFDIDKEMAAIRARLSS